MFALVTGFLLFFLVFPLQGCHVLLLLVFVVLFVFVFVSVFVFVFFFVFVFIYSYSFRVSLRAHGCHVSLCLMMAPGFEHSHTTPSTTNANNKTTIGASSRVEGPTTNNVNYATQKMPQGHIKAICNWKDLQMPSRQTKA